LLRTIVDNIRNIQDPARIAQINALIEEYRVNMVCQIWFKVLIHLTIANSGVPEKDHGEVIH